MGEQVVSKLRIQIMSGELKKGTILSENQLSAEFGTSRSPIREALRTLSNEGLIDLQRMGAVVIGLTARDLNELYDVRLLLEHFVLERLSEVNHDSLIKKLEQSIDQMNMAAKYDDYVEFAYQDLRFHELVIIEADHKRILKLWESIREIILAALLITTEKRFRDDKAAVLPLIKQHHEMIKALKSQNTERIQDEVKRHFEDTRNTITASLLNEA
ncbi:GntR family transcriptional regulator [Priestia sp. YIM B13446]|uniref:GntR family transcriptional regulator n=1 Tax=Priestia TaxID=2800373 RepID=UPI0020D26236|nr:GntR family transcriptional regulator [Priestia megaterium]MCU7738473.1 GntR family transcriptional regulator [Priestia megaterium]MCU7743882.1 GntR family transcriptional regulator [Priestia megaterium]MDC7721524.1 GntR family transcriptional regulator [Priestia megaterium]MED4062965.1 GntR family transcriptional regulator [Priestia megaterium]MEE3896184.1 GntR family transcriptional regulator [Priestia megaterium]